MSLSNSITVSNPGSYVPDAGRHRPFSSSRIAGVLTLIGMSFCKIDVKGFTPHLIGLKRVYDKGVR